jgi:hypothetical protein
MPGAGANAGGSVTMTPGSGVPPVPEVELVPAPAPPEPVDPAAVPPEPGFEAPPPEPELLAPPLPDDVPVLAPEPWFPVVEPPLPEGARSPIFPVQALADTNTHKMASALARSWTRGGFFISVLRSESGMP